MESRERLLRAVNRESVDRIPTDIWLTGEVLDKLKKHFGVSADAEVYRRLEVDRIEWYPLFANVVPLPEEYAGPPRQENEDAYGMRYRKQAYMDGSGSYMEWAFHPLQELNTIGEVKDNYTWPRAEWFDFSNTRKNIEKLLAQGHAVLAGCGAPFTIYTYLRGIETALMDLAGNREYAHYVLDKVFAFEYALLEKLFDVAGDLIDFSFLAEDVGFQTGPMMSVDTFEEYLPGYYRRYAKLMHDHEVKVFFHSDGGIRPFIQRLIDVGIDVLNPIQWKCTGMDRAELQKDFGKQVCFHGGVDNQKILPFGSPKDVEAEVYRCLETLVTEGTGYILAPCHNIQINTPVENIVTLYQAAHQYTFSSVKGSSA